MPFNSSNYYRGKIATEYKKTEEHVLDYYSRIRDLTQSIIEKESKLVGRLKRSVEQKIEDGGLDAFIRRLPKGYRTAIRFKRFSDFNAALICLLILDKQIKEDEQRFASCNSKNRTANIRQIKEIIQCDYCKKTGHTENYCLKKRVCTHCKRRGHTENRCYLEKKENNGNISGRNSPNRPSSPTKSKNKKSKQCSFCRKLGYNTGECYTLKRTIERANQGNDLQGTTKDARRSPTPKQCPCSPSPVAGELSVNSTDNRSITLAVSISTDGRCLGTQYSDTDETWDNVVVQSVVRTNIRTYTATLTSANLELIVTNIYSYVERNLSAHSFIKVGGGGVILAELGVNPTPASRTRRSELETSRASIFRQQQNS
ncbi:hypothetical protein M0802_010641 [Mischocyttarus mexicanus]|nr:hypothetical protein M0802_010641 [Mischocyttarus mexicanus]